MQQIRPGPTLSVPVIGLTSRGLSAIGDCIGIYTCMTMMSAGRLRKEMSTAVSCQVHWTLGWMAEACAVIVGALHAGALTSEKRRDRLSDGLTPDPWLTLSGVDKVSGIVFSNQFTIIGFPCVMILSLCICAGWPIRTFPIRMIMTLEQYIVVFDTTGKFHF